MIDATKIIENYRRFFASFWPGIFRISAKNTPLLSLRPSLTVGMAKIPKTPGLFHYFFCWNLRNLPTEPTSEMLASFTEHRFVLEVGNCTNVVTLFIVTHQAGSKHGGMGGLCAYCPDDVRTRGQECPGAASLALSTLRLTTLAKTTIS